MARRKVQELTESQKRVARLRYGRIDVDHLAKLTVEFCEKKKRNPDYQMSNELGEIINVIVDKMLGQGQWRGYTPDWKEEMRGKAYEHTVKYVKNFKMELVLAGKPDAAFSYYAMIITNAFKQSVKQLKAYTEKNALLNDALGYDKESIDSEKSIINSESIFPDETRLDYESFL